MRALRLFRHKKSQMPPISEEPTIRVRCPVCQTHLELKPTMQLWEEIVCRSCRESLMLTEENPHRLETTSRAIFRRSL